MDFVFNNGGGTWDNNDGADWHIAAVADGGGGGGTTTLVVAPTIDLVGQWYDHLRRAFGEPVGVLGGGVHEVHPITVSTYDSAYLNVERYGNRFGLVVFDEVHHLPSASYGSAAELCLAPWRLGLSATIERPDGLHNRLARMQRGAVHLALWKQFESILRIREHFRNL
jgi:superfamily II DNA or RNA helicase